MSYDNKALALRLLSNLFPSRCILCNQTVSGFPADEGRVNEGRVNEAVELCIDCCRSQPFNDSSCKHCALPLAEGIAGNVSCGRCIKKPPVYDYAHSIFRYEDDIIGLVHRLKFSEKITYARSIGELFLSAFNSEEIFKSELPDCLLPVPLHHSRLRKRGFNQSIEIARVLNKKKNIPIEYKAVVRQRRTTSQTGLDAKHRSKNIKGAFTVVNKLQYKHVLIIDDVVTTGSTVNELAKVLKKNGVDRVGVLSIARAPVKG